MAPPAFILFVLVAACSVQSDQPVKAARQANERQEVADEKERDAGFAWAKKRGVADPTICVSDSRSFVEGCQTYVSVMLQSSEASRTQE